MSAPYMIKQEMNTTPNHGLYVPIPSYGRLGDLNLNHGDTSSDSSSSLNSENLISALQSSSQTKQSDEEEQCECDCEYIYDQDRTVFEELMTYYNELTSQPYYQQVYSRLPSILSAAVVSFNLGELTPENVALVTASYITGDVLFPVIVANYGLSYLYENYLYNKF